MEPEANLVTQLLDAIEELLIENQALRSGMGVLEQFLPVQARDRIRKHVADIKADANLRATVRNKFARLRDQPIDETIGELLKTLPRKKDVN